MQIQKIKNCLRADIPMLSIIIPTYNEANNITAVVKQIHASLKKIKHEIIIVDDNSPDQTAHIAQKLAKKFPLKVIVRTKDKGLAKSVLDGFKQAQGDTFVVMDADLSHPPEVLPRLYNELKKTNADIVVASRLVPGGGVEGWPKTRRLTSYVAAMLAKPLTSVKDPMSGFFLLKKEVIQDVPLSPLGYKILLEILVKGKYATAKEIPYTFKDRTAGVSKLNARVNFEYLLHIARLYLYKLRKKLK